MGFISNVQYVCINVFPNNDINDAFIYFLCLYIYIFLNIRYKTHEQMNLEKYISCKLIIYLYIWVCVTFIIRHIESLIMKNNISFAQHTFFSIISFLVITLNSIMNFNHLVNISDQNTTNNHVSDSRLIDSRFWFPYIKKKTWKEKNLFFISP